MFFQADKSLNFHAGKYTLILIAIAYQTNQKYHL